MRKEAIMQEETMPCFAYVKEGDKLLWSNGPYMSQAEANKAAERQAIILKYQKDRV